MADEAQNPEEASPEFSKVAVGLVIAVIVLAGVVYAGYQYSQRQAKKVTYPNGYQAPQQAQNPANPADIDCANRDPNISFWDWYNKCDQIKADPAAGLTPIRDEKLGFEVQIPSNIKLQKYDNGVGIIYKDVQPNLNLLYNLELASLRSGEFKDLKGQAYVENYWKQYSGLKGMASTEPIINSSGSKGYKAFYYVFPNVKGNTEIFFELGENTGDFIHFSKGILTEETFNTIIGSVKIFKGGEGTEETPTVTAKPTKVTPTDEP